LTKPTFLKNVGRSAKNVDYKKCWSRKMLTRKNIGKTSKKKLKKMLATLLKNADEKMLVTLLKNFSENC
jgi:hypothetical protein